VTNQRHETIQSGQGVDALWDFSNAAASEIRFREALDQFGQSGDRDLHGEILTQIARAEGLQKRFAEAHATLDAVEAELPDRSARVRARYLLERGRVINTSGDPERSRPLFVQAWQTARAAGDDYYAVDAAHMLAIVEPHDKQLRWFHRALELAVASDDERARNWCGALYNNAGWFYCETNHFKEALDMFEKGLAFRETQGEPGAIRIAKWTVARCLRSLGRVDEALTIQEALIKELEAAGETDGFVFEELGECLYALNREREARARFKAAYDVLSKDSWLAEKEPERIARLGRLGGLV
jgi:tetratricopeptide (TPR) repeat protein